MQKQSFLFRFVVTCLMLCFQLDAFHRFQWLQWHVLRPRHGSTHKPGPKAPRRSWRTAVLRFQQRWCISRWCRESFSMFNLYLGVSDWRVDLVPANTNEATSSFNDLVASWNSLSLSIEYTHIYICIPFLSEHAWHCGKASDSYECISCFGRREHEQISQKHFALFGLQVGSNKVNRQISAIIEKYFPTEILGVKLEGLIRCNADSHGVHQGVLELMTSYIFMPRSRERQKQIAMAEAEARWNARGSDECSLGCQNVEENHRKQLHKNGM